MFKHYDDPFLSDKRNRSGLYFIGNTPELDKEFKRIRAGLRLESQTNELPRPIQAEGENISGQEQPGDGVSPSRPVVAPIQKQRGGCSQ